MGARRDGHRARPHPRSSQPAPPGRISTTGRTAAADRLPRMTPRPYAVLVAVLALVPAAGFAATPAPHAAPAATTAAPAATSETGRPLVFEYIHDDYARAVAAAKAHKVPIFVDAGAPWCHTCRSMDAFVFTDERLKKDKDRFVY